MTDAPCGYPWSTISDVVAADLPYFARHGVALDPHRCGLPAHDATVQHRCAHCEAETA